MNRLIVIEGLDGSGKSTQIKRLREYLKRNKIKYKYIHFPRTKSPIYGELISRFLRGDLGRVEDVNPYLVSLLYAGDRNDAKDQIRDWLDKEYLVLLDRYVYSNIAFQCAKLQSREEKQRLLSWILNLEYEYNHIPKPQMSVYLHVPFQFIKDKLSKKRKGVDREYLKDSYDIHEKSIQLQKRVEEEYLKLSKEFKDIHFISCLNRSGDMEAPDVIHEKILELLRENAIIP